MACENVSRAKENRAFTHSFLARPGDVKQLLVPLRVLLLTCLSGFCMLLTDASRKLSRTSTANLNDCITITELHSLRHEGNGGRWPWKDLREPEGVRHGLIPCRNPSVSEGNENSLRGTVFCTLALLTNHVDLPEMFWKLISTLDCRDYTEYAILSSSTPFITHL